MDDPWSDNWMPQPVFGRMQSLLNNSNETISPSLPKQQKEAAKRTEIHSFYVLSKVGVEENTKPFEVRWSIPVQTKQL